MKFDGDGLYNNNLVTDIYHTSSFVELEASEGSQFTTSRENGLYKHTINTFVEDLVYTDLANFDLASKSRKYLVMFLTNTGKYLLFGYKPGAAFSYSSQTEESIGSQIELSVSTTYPIFEVRKEAITDATHAVTYAVSDINAFCETFDDGYNTGVFQYRYMLKISARNGEPLDVDNQLCSKSGKLQAILALQGSPQIEGYELQGYYDKRASIGGVSTFIVDSDTCPLRPETSVTIDNYFFEGIGLICNGNTEFINIVNYNNTPPTISTKYIEDEVGAKFDMNGLVLKYKGDEFYMTFGLPITYGDPPSGYNQGMLKHLDGGMTWLERAEYAKENGWFWYPETPHINSVYAKYYPASYNFDIGDSGNPKRAFMMSYIFGLIASAVYDGTQTKDIIFDAVTQRGFKPIGFCEQTNPINIYRPEGIFIPTDSVNFNIIPSHLTVDRSAGAISGFVITARNTYQGGSQVMVSDIATYPDLMRPYSGTTRQDVAKECEYYLKLALSTNPQLAKAVENGKVIL